MGVLTSQLMSYLVVYATPRDPLILVGVFLTMVLLGVLATFVPARRTLAIKGVRNQIYRKSPSFIAS